MSKLFIKGRHRAAYKYYYGNIPKDANGLTYDIHHLDGDNSNNSKENLLAVSVNEHHKIHYDQGDYHACLMIEQRMNKDENFYSDVQNKLVDSGQHPFLKANRGNKPFGNEFTSDSIKESVVNWINEGRHVSVDGSEAKLKRNKTMTAIGEDGLNIYQRSRKKASKTLKAKRERDIVLKIKEAGIKLNNGWWYMSTEKLESIYLEHVK